MPSAARSPLQALFGITVCITLPNEVCCHQGSQNETLNHLHVAAVMAAWPRPRHYLSGGELCSSEANNDESLQPVTVGQTSGGEPGGSGSRMHANLLKWFIARANSLAPGALTEEDGSSISKEISRAFVHLAILSWKICARVFWANKFEEY